MKSNLPFAEPSPARLDGIPIVLDGKQYVMPACSLATLKRNAKMIDKFAKATDLDVMDEASINLLVNVIHEALKRNYPDITAQFVEDHVGVDVMQETFQYAMDVSGLIRKSLRQAESPTAGAAEGGSLGESTGTESLPT